MVSTTLHTQYPIHPATKLNDRPPDLPYCTSVICSPQCIALVFIRGQPVVTLCSLLVVIWGLVLGSILCGRWIRRLRSRHLSSGLLQQVSTNKREGVGVRLRGLRGCTVFFEAFAEVYLTYDGDDESANHQRQCDGRYHQQQVTKTTHDNDMKSLSRITGGRESYQR